MAACAKTHVSIPLQKEPRDHELQRRTLSCSRQRRDVDEYIDSPRLISTLLSSRVFAACFLFQLRDRAKEASPTRDFWTESGQRKTSSKTTRKVGRHDKLSTGPENFIELAELERCDKSVGAPAGCVHTQDTNRQADLSMIAAAKKMYKTCWKRRMKL